MSKTFKKADFGDPHQMAKMYFGVYVCSQIDSILSAVHSDESQIDRLFGDDESLEFYGGFEHQSKFSVH